jgi:nitrile hydratase
MNGIHDMGGMTCFGPVLPEHNEPVFHSEWERRVFAMNMAGTAFFGPVDRVRHAIERLDPVLYLSASYYEKWLAAIELLTKEFGVLTDDEISTGVAATPGPATEPPPGPEIIAAVIQHGEPVSRQTGRLNPVYTVGDVVRARNVQPQGHTRLPRYVRGKLGKIAAVHGTHVYPDSNAHDQGENPQPLYNVKFSAQELWGEGAPQHDYVYIDLWEDYLEAKV